MGKRLDWFSSYLSPRAARMLAGCWNTLWHANKVLPQHLAVWSELAQTIGTRKVHVFLVIDGCSVRQGCKPSIGVWERRMERRLHVKCNGASGCMLHPIASPCWGVSKRLGLQNT